MAAPIQSSLTAHLTGGQDEIIGVTTSDPPTSRNQDVGESLGRENAGRAAFEYLLARSTGSHFREHKLKKIADSLYFGCERPLLELPPEIIQQILSYLGGNEISTIERTCRDGRNHVLADGHHIDALGIANVIHRIKEDASSLQLAPETLFNDVEAYARSFRKEDVECVAKIVLETPGERALLYPKINILGTLLKANPQYVDQGRELKIGVNLSTLDASPTARAAALGHTELIRLLLGKFHHIDAKKYVAEASHTAALAALGGHADSLQCVLDDFRMRHASNENRVFLSMLRTALDGLLAAGFNVSPEIYAIFQGYVERAASEAST